MISCAFVLEKSVSDKPEMIFLYSRIKGKRFRFSTKKKILPRDWVASEGRPKEGIPLERSITKALITHKKYFYGVLEEIEYNRGEPTVESVKYLMNVRMSRKQSIETIGTSSLWDYFEHFAKKMHKTHAYNTARGFDTAILRLKKFNPFLEWSDINKKTYLAYIEHLEEKGFSRNYIGSLITRVRIMCNKAWNEEVQKGSDHKTWKRMEEVIETTYFTEEEIEKIYDLKIEKEGHEHARDLFVLACWTGMRSINTLNFDPTTDILRDLRIIKVFSDKGVSGQSSKIPLHWTTEDILEKYNNVLPKLSYQTMNEYIKDVAREAGFTEMFKYQKTVGGKKTVISKPRWETVSTHTARRSFATNLMKQEIPIPAIMYCTGHKRVDTFMKYIKMNGEESAIMIGNHKSFQRPASRAKNTAPDIDYCI